MTDKEKLSVTVDQDVVEAARAAVAAGRASSVSAWINDVLQDYLAHQRRLHSLDRFIADYEAENGVITDEDIAAAQRAVDARSIVVYGKQSHGAA